MFKKLILILSVFILTGCSASLYNLPTAESVPEITEWSIYENQDLGITFRYPSYYGDPITDFVEGKTGQIFKIRFIFGENLEDPYVFYLGGASSDYVPSNKFEREFYKGSLAKSSMCQNKESIIPFIQFVGESCVDFALNNSEIVGVTFNAAILDLTSNSVESLIFANAPDDFEYSGLQIGLKLPLSTVGTGERQVVRTIKKMDKLNLDKELVEEIQVFRLVSEGIEFFN